MTAPVYIKLFFVQAWVKFYMRESQLRIVLFSKAQPITSNLLNWVHSVHWHNALSYIFLTRFPKSRLVIGTNCIASVSVTVLRKHRCWPNIYSCVVLRLRQLTAQICCVAVMCFFVAFLLVVRVLVSSQMQIGTQCNCIVYRLLHLWL